MWIEEAAGWSLTLSRGRSLASSHKHPIGQLNSSAQMGSSATLGRPSSSNHDGHSMIYKYITSPDGRRRLAGRPIDAGTTVARTPVVGETAVWPPQNPHHEPTPGGEGRRCSRLGTASRGPRSSGQLNLVFKTCCFDGFLLPFRRHRCRSFGAALPSLTRSAKTSLNSGQNGNNNKSLMLPLAVSKAEQPVGSRTAQLCFIVGELVPNVVDVAAILLLA